MALALLQIDITVSSASSLLSCSSQPGFTFQEYILILNLL